MITSVTSATLVATSAVAGWGVVLGAGGALLVIAMLTTLELLGATEGSAARIVYRSLRIATGPLVITFAVGIMVEVLAILARS